MSGTHKLQLSLSSTEWATVEVSSSLVGDRGWDLFLALVAAVKNTLSTNGKPKEPEASPLTGVENTIHRHRVVIVTPTKAVPPRPEKKKSGRGGYRPPVDPKIRGEADSLLLLGKDPKEVLAALENTFPGMKLPCLQSVINWSKAIKPIQIRHSDFGIGREPEEKPPPLVHDAYTEEHPPLPAEPVLPEYISMVVLSQITGERYSVLWERAESEDWEYDDRDTQDKKQWMFLVRGLPDDVQDALKENWN